VVEVEEGELAQDLYDPPHPTPTSNTSNYFCLKKFKETSSAYRLKC